MTTKHKIFLAIFFAACTASGYAVYWWHESSLDSIARLHLSYRGKPLDEVRTALSEKRPSDARGRLDRLPEFEKVGILKVLSRDESVPVRMFAVRYMRGLRDLPKIRAELARIASNDADDSVSRLAMRALQGKR